MPYEVREDGPEDRKFCVYRKTGGETLGCHDSAEKAQAQIAAIWANEGAQKGDEEIEKATSAYFERIVGFVKEQAPWIIKWYHNAARGYAGGKAAPKDAMPWMEQVAMQAMRDEDLVEADDDDLAHVHKRLHQIYARAEKSTPTVADVHVPSFEGMGRKPLDIRAAHKSLVAELTKRGLKHLEKDGLDKTEVGKSEDLYAEIVKADVKQQRVWAVVLEPKVLDAQGDWESPEEIEKAAHDWLESFQEVGTDHKGQANPKIRPCESYITKADEKLGGQDVPKGSWVLGVHVLDKGEWQRVEKGELNGFSVQGFGKRTQKSLH